MTKQQIYKMGSNSGYRHRDVRGDCIGIEFGQRDKDDYDTVGSMAERRHLGKLPYRSKTGKLMTDWF